mmetsp:Transcript_3912/g.6133  ORF Transcript_3912/g.6133 Transcript_3912/m.6133 type:complete len:312 (+) Transcript_3912:79-1014(+)
MQSIMKCCGQKYGTRTASLKFQSRQLSRASFRYVPQHITRTEYADTGSPQQAPPYTYIFKNDEIQYMRESALIARYILDYACSVAEAGMTTDDVDRLAHEEIIRKGAFPSPLNYYGFPKSICTSVNNIACHGIPNTDDVLADGDVLSIDVSVFYRGYHGDNCKTVIIGEDKIQKSDREWKRQLLDINLKALEDAISICGPGKCITEIGSTIQKVADSNGYSSVEDFCGHGLGKTLHMPPLILHYKNNNRQEMVPNMIFTIEPIFTVGRKEIGVSPADNWSVFTQDGSIASQFEHEVLITEHGAEVLTVPEL